MNLLMNAESRSFTSFLSCVGLVGFSHNPLQHLRWLMAEGLVLRDKETANGFGRPNFTYHIPYGTTKQVISALEDPHVELVAIPFSCIRHICRFG